MKKEMYNKLVRDRIPEIMRQDGWDPKTRILGEDEYAVALRDKLIEEATELHDAIGRDEIVKELGDLWEVVEALMKQKDISLTEVQSLKQKRRMERGGFDDKIFLIESSHES